MKNLKVYFLKRNNYNLKAETKIELILGWSADKWIGEALESKIEKIDALPLDSCGRYSLILDSSVPHITEEYIEKALDYMLYREKSGLKISGGYILNENFTGDYCELEKYAVGGNEMSPIESREDFISVSKLLSLRNNKRLINCGVDIEDLSSVFIDRTASIESGVKIAAFNIIKGESVIKEGAKLYPYNSVINSQIGRECEIKASTIEESKVGEKTTVGPYAYLRKNTDIGKNCRIGDFVEIKNSVIGDGTKVAHHAYVGDAILGEKVNVGCGVVFANYDGIAKYQSIVKDRVFIGCNTNLIAPIEVGEGCYIAAGATICEDLPPDSFVIGRSKCIVKREGAKRYLK